VDAYRTTLQEWAELEHYTNLREAHLYWLHDPVIEVFPILKRCSNLRRITLKGGKRFFIPSSEEFCDFIMKLKHLIFLHIIYASIPSCDHFISVVGQVEAFVLPRRPNFKFYVSCCSKFPESRVPGEFDF